MKIIKNLLLLISIPALVMGQTTYETVHPYTDNENQLATLSIAGASKLKVKITGELENTYDFIEIINTNHRYTGAIDKEFVVNGDSIDVHFTSDYSVQKNGVKVTISAHPTECYTANNEDDLQAVFNTYDCVQLNGIYELNENITIDNKNLKVMGGTLKTMKNDIILRIQEDNITFDSVTFDFNRKEFYASGTSSPIVVDENLKNIKFKNSIFKDILAKAINNGKDTKTQQYAIQASINNLDLTIDHCSFKNFHISTNKKVFSGFVGGILISMLDTKSHYTAGGEIAILNSTFENMSTTKDEYFKQQNADGIRSYAPKLSKKQQTGTTVRVEDSTFYNISQSSIKLGSVTAIIKRCKTYNNTKDTPQYAAYRANTTRSFTVDDVEAHGNIKNMIIVSGENIKLTNIRNYAPYHAGSTILLGHNRLTQNIIINNMRENNSWSTIYFKNVHKAVISRMSSTRKKYRFLNDINKTLDDFEITFDDISKENATFIPEMMET